MNWSQVFHSTEFWSALFGVTAGFFFTALSDLARGWVARSVRCRRIDDEVEMIRCHALNGLRASINNNNIAISSRESPLMVAAPDVEFISNKEFIAMAGIPIKKRKLLSSISMLASSLDEKHERIREHVKKQEPKIRWSLVNTLSAESFAFVLCNCDVYLGFLDADLLDSVSAEEFSNNNERTLELVEGRYSLKIPRHED